MTRITILMAMFALAGFSTADAAAASAAGTNAALNSYLIYWPVLAQVLVPLLVLLLNGKRKAGDVKSGDFDRHKAAMDNEAWSKATILTSKNLANQFQFPVIFYVLCIVLASLNAVSTAVLAVAWLFVAARYIHAYVHVTSNYVPARMRSFIVSIVLLLVLFGMAVTALLRV